MREIFGDAWPDHSARDLELIRQPIDFLGVNYYTRRVVRHDDAAWPTRSQPVRIPDALYTETDWEVHPESLTRTLCWVKERYGDIPIYITENGAAFPDSAGADRDRRRSAARLLLPRASARGPRGDSPRASTCAATSPGRCSTTSSGRAATRSASG